MSGLQVPKRYRCASYRHASGFTLIETLVVLVVLLIGIFAIVRLFPPGFLSIFKTGEVTTGGALVNQTLDTQKNQVNQQEAIVAMSPFTGMVDSYNILPDDLNDYPPGFIGGVDPWYWSNADKLRNIIGETFPIGIATSNTGDASNGQSYGAVYPLQFGPVSNTLTANGDSILVYGMPLQRTTQSIYPTLANPTGAAVLQNESQYAIDYDNLMIAFYPRLIDPSRPVAARQFTISFQYYTNTNGQIGIQYQPNNYATTLITVPDVPVPLPGQPQPQPVWQPLFNAPFYSNPYTNQTGSVAPPLPGGITPPPNFYVPPGAQFPLPQNQTMPYCLVHDSEEVSRKFRLALVNNTVEAGGVPTWSNADPYEYAWYSQQNPSNTANPGILIFNPSGHNMQQQNEYGTQALKARVDYQIFDNHVLRDDRNVPSSAPYNITLSIPGLKLGGDILDNTNPLNNFNNTLLVYNGIYRDSVNTTPDIIIYNVNTGQQVGSWTNINWPGSQSGPGTGVLTIDPAVDPTPLDQKTSILTLNPNFVAANNLQGASLRIFYRTQHDWGVQVQKAAAHYVESSLPSGVDYMHYYIGDGTTGVATRIYFAPCDAGKTVVIGQFYATPLPNKTLQSSNGQYRDQTLQITSNPAQFDQVPGASAPLPYVDVIQIDPSIGGFSAAQTGLRVDNVQGSSIKARAIWLDNQRWRKLDNDSFMVQKPLQ